MATITISSDNGSLPVYEAEPPEDIPRGGVIVVQEAWGVTPHIEAIADKLAGLDWHVLVPHLYHRQGDPTFDYSQLDEVKGVMENLDAEAILSDIDVCLDYFERNGIDAERTAVIGFCMGGTVAFAVAARREVGAAVSYYGGGVTAGRFGFPALVDMARDLKADWLGLYGGQDQGIPQSDTDALRDAVAGSEVEAELVVYPEAGHAFNNSDRESAYNPEAAAAAWERAIDWISRHAATA